MRKSERTEEILEKMREVISGSKDKRALMQYLLSNVAREMKTFSLSTVSNWGKMNVSRHFLSESSWVQNMVSVGYARHFGEARDGLYELTEEGLAVAMAFAEERTENTLTILGDPKVGPDVGHHYDTSQFRDPTRSAPRGMDARDPGADGWDAYLKDD